MTVDQLELFGAGVATSTRPRQVDALTCLRDAVPEALQVVVELRNWHTDSRARCRSGDWAYCVSDAGLRFEHVTDQHVDTEGWNPTPAHLLPWGELTALIGDDPRRTDITAWVESLPEPRWRQLHRPHELWPDPGDWHTGYLCRDHLDPHWPGRRHAWQLVLDLLTDAIRDTTGDTLL